MQVILLPTYVAVNSGRMRGTCPQYFTWAISIGISPQYFTFSLLYGKDRKNGLFRFNNAPNILLAGLPQTMWDSLQTKDTMTPFYQITDDYSHHCIKA